MNRTPANFSYLIADKIAGSGHPGSGELLGQTLASLREEGFGAVISVCEAPLERAMLEEFGFEYLHLPVVDFSAPTMEQIEKAVAFAKRRIESGARVLIHCFAGYGRTGTMLACYLVHEGRAAADAIDEVRLLRPGSIEDPSQEVVIHQYEQRLKEPASREGSAGED